MSLVATTRSASSLAVSENRHEIKRSHWLEQMKLEHWVICIETTMSLVKTITTTLECMSLVGNTSVFVDGKLQNRRFKFCDWSIIFEKNQNTQHPEGV